MKEKWALVFRNIFATWSMDEQSMTDDEILDFAKACFCTEFSEILNVKEEWQYEMHFKALIKYVNPSDSLMPDISKLSSIIDKNNKD